MKRPSTIRLCAESNVILIWPKPGFTGQRENRGEASGEQLVVAGLSPAIFALPSALLSRRCSGGFVRRPPFTYPVFGVGPPGGPNSKRFSALSNPARQEVWR